MSRTIEALRELASRGETQGERDAAISALVKLCGQADPKRRRADHAHDHPTQNAARIEVPSADLMRERFADRDPFVIRWRGCWWIATGVSGTEISGCTRTGAKFFLTIDRSSITRVSMRALRCAS